MQINNLSNYTKNKNIVLLSKKNPFKKGTLQYYLLSFIIKNHSTLSKYTNASNNLHLLTFLSSKKESFYIDPWNGNRLFDTALSLSIVHNIIKITKVINKPIFGIFTEDGLFDILNEPLFINQLKKVPQTDNVKLLWLSLYLNQKIRQQNHVPQINFSQKELSYTGKKFSITIDNVPYNKIFDTTLEIPLAAFSDSWYSEDWIALNSRGLFHHVGDHIGFFYGAKSVGQCYFVGRDTSNHLVTLSTPHKTYAVESNYEATSSCHKLFSHLHPTDFTYIYGVPKGNPGLFSEPMLITSDIEDCKQNNYSNVLSAEHFWDNPVFMKNNHRKMFVGSIEDKFKDILHNIEDLLNEEQLVVVKKLINNQSISKKDLINTQLISSDNNASFVHNIKKRSSFFMKSLAHKTVCEIFNPTDNLELGFFMKHNGSVPQNKSFFIFDLLLQCFAFNQRIIHNPLFHMKKNFIFLFLREDREFINVWDDDDKKGFLFSELVSMQNEYRMFIINNRVVATSACFRNTVPLNAWQNGRFDPRLVNGHNGQTTHINRNRVAQYAKFARHFSQQMQLENPQCHSYVLDVAWCEEKNTVVPIEINSITWSGAYQTNMHRVCAATLKKPFDYLNLLSFIQDKCDMWLSLIDNNVIKNSMFDLAGLDRTLKGNTQLHLQHIIFNTINTIYPSLPLNDSLDCLSPDNTQIPIDNNQQISSIFDIMEELDILMEDILLNNNDDDIDIDLDDNNLSKN